ncbi:hypothetical protein [Qipengyuania nanhaisediminis]|uniref:hypothetical protein n=1 Tax=Qipengyuania nanhaisediminis TaxID=604088 RepID=UPI0038B319C0
MDNLRGTFDTGIPAEESQDWDAHDDAPDNEDVTELPPEAIGQDERRMQVRAYNHWASLLGEASFPSIEELDPAELPDFGPNSVLLDFSGGIEDPAVQFLGDKLAEECGATQSIARLSDVPPRSLLSRITDHYMQILANQAPIGFEAEFVNQQGVAILYRGILLPFSSDRETIDFIYGVINWKEMADAATADELLLEIDQAIEADSEDEPVEDEDQPHKHHADPVTDWADSPAHEADAQLSPENETEPQDDEAQEFANCDAQDADDDGNAQELDDFAAPFEPSDRDEDGLPIPDFGQYGLDEPEVDEFGEEIGEEDDDANYSFASLSDYIETPAKKAIDLDAERFDPEDYRVDNITPVDAETDQSPGDAEGDNEAGPQAGPETGETSPDSSPEPQPLEPQAESAPLVPADNDSDGEASGDIAAPFDPLTAGELPENADLYDCLASARELASNARASEDRSRTALYAAVGRAYDVSLAADAEPDAFAELLEDCGLARQVRAPMTPVVKLVFGPDYDKTRLTEYAAVLSHAHRLGLERGSLAGFLTAADGGLKGVVAAERRLRREESGKPALDPEELREQLAEKLRELEALTLEALASDGPEFSLAVLRRDKDGQVAILGEVAGSDTLTEKVAKKLVG